ncbi:MAG: hypothetical protein N4A71_14870 [Carboxylicivirga sp.]|jgi:hypothetical protein|nr:hypothetical protein [Carboxylicivirga sp.]
MTKSLDDQKFELITQKGNFEFAFDIYETFESIIDRLEDDFWKNLNVELNKKFIDYSISQDVDDESVTLIKHKSFRDVAFFIQLHDNQFIYGFYIPCKQNQLKKIGNEYKPEFEDLWLDSEKKIAWFWDGEPFDTSKLSLLKKILPNEDKLLKSYLRIVDEMIQHKTSILLEYEKNLK